MTDIFTPNNDQRLMKPFVLLFVFVISLILVASPLMSSFDSSALCAFAFVPAIIFWFVARLFGRNYWLEFERNKTGRLANAGSLPVGAAPCRDAFEKKLEKISLSGGASINKFLIGFDLLSGEPVWLDDCFMSDHICALSTRSSEKTAWLEALIFQQLARSQGNGFIYIDCKKDSDSLSTVIRMAQDCGRIDDLIVIDPERPVHKYNLMQAVQPADVKAYKILKIALPEKLQNKGSAEDFKLVSDYLFRIVRIFESTGLSWSLKDVAALLGNPEKSLDYLRSLLAQTGNRQASLEVAQLEMAIANQLETNIRKILQFMSVELSSFADSPLSESFCNSANDFTLGSAIDRGKIIYFKMPADSRSSAARLIRRAFREDLKISMTEARSVQNLAQQDISIVLIDADSSSDLTAWSSLIETARGRPFCLLFGAAFEAKSEISPYALDRSFCEEILVQTGFRAFIDLDLGLDSQDLSQQIRHLKGRKDRLDTSNRNREAVSIPELQEFDIHRFEPFSAKFVAWFDRGGREPEAVNPIKLRSELPEGWDGRVYLQAFQRQGLDELGIQKWLSREVAD